MKTTSYECKVMTSKFSADVKKALESIIDKNVTGFARVFRELEIRSLLNSVWNNKIEVGDDLKHVLKDLNILVPTYTIETFARQDFGLQNKARIKYKGEIQKIDDIEEIFNYKSVTVESEAPLFSVN